MDKQLFNGILLALGALLILVAIVNEQVHVTVKILGIILLMTGAYLASRHWARHKDDHLNDEEEQL